jgi:putative nucleotidyltransferase with HDIG domain
MKLDSTFLHSKLARRIFWLFVLCALVPITVLALVSLRNVSSQLKEQSLRELHQITREEANVIYERLSFLEVNMSLVASEIRRLDAAPHQASSELSNDSYSGLTTRLQGMDLVLPGGKRRNVFGAALPPFVFSAAELEALRSGNVLSTVPCGKPEPCILLSKVVDNNDPAQGVLIGEIRPSYLWDSKNLPEAISVCVLNPSGAQLFCSGPAPERFPGRVSSTFSGQFEWQRGGREYLASYWNLPLQSTFYVPHWSIVSSKGKLDVLAPLVRFRGSFVLVFLLALWIVVLLSLIQIRRNLVPLAKLQDGTRAISLGDFQTRVIINSGDEFEDLAASFNAMAGRIERQLKALKVIDEIDGAILSAWNPTRIVGRVCSRLRDLLPHDLVCVYLFDSDRSCELFAQVFSPGSETAEHAETIELTPEDAEALRERREVTILDENDVQPSYLACLSARGMRHFLIVPVLSDKGMSAIFSLGHHAAQVWNEEDKQHAKHLADQIAVALSNAQLLTELEQVQWGTLTALARAIDAKSPWTLGHSERVTDLAIKIGQALGLPARQLDVMRRGGLLHDIGKIGTPAEILDRPGKLTDEEMKIMRDHVNIGVRILQPISGLAESMSIVAQHHEWVNGRGYPNGLSGDAITLHARIFAVADCFDALVSDRPYRAGMPVARVMKILEEGAGKQFDPVVLDTFRAMMAKQTGAPGHAELPKQLVEVK